MSGLPRILQVAGSLNVGGAETMLVSATRELVRMGFNVDFLVFGTDEGTLEPQVTSLGCRILRADRPNLAHRARFTRTLTDLIRAEGPFDVVHSHVNFASGLVLAAADRAGVPVRIAHSHSASDLRSDVAAKVYTKRSRTLIFRHATVFAAAGNDAGTYMFGDRWQGRGVVIRNGIDVDSLLAGRSLRMEVRNELGIDAGAVLVGAVGRLVAPKNHAFLVRMVAEASSDDLQLVFVGEGPLRRELEAAVDGAGIADRVTFLGLRSDIPRVLSALDLVLMPSLYEGVPLALIESQAAGIPALASASITAEADLGLGLIQFLPIEDPRLWERVIRDAQPRVVDDEVIRRRFAETGYDTATSARHLADIYRGER